MATLSQLINALPREDVPQSPQSAPTPAHDSTLTPVPVGRLRRIGLLASLQTWIFAAYLFYWLRGWFQNAEDRQQLLAETHWRTALRVLDSMSYLRGATMKAGQMLAAFPHVIPSDFVATVEKLHVEAPPIHASLVREIIHSELGDDPENLFAAFDRRPFAAASLGQVHRAQLKSGEPLAVKIQYPGIARTIAEDFANLGLFLLPARLSPDWENTREQFDDLRTRIEQETDYHREARTLQKVRSLFRPEDGIVVPQVYPELSTARVLTMERLEGVHLEQFLATDPPQQLRNDFAAKIIRAWYRMMYAGRMVYGDYNPGNVLFMPDGRLGLIDFGCVIDLDDELWILFRKMDRPLTTGNPDERKALLKEWCRIRDDEHDRLRVCDEYLDWSWGPRYCGCAFDFGDEPYMRRGITLMTEMVRRRYNRGHPCSPIMTRQQLGLQALLYRLEAKFNITPICEQEVTAAGWDRSDYAPR